ncbi:uncharacterized protein N7482_006093 [Penicillium canariense]|uniref:Uncharacterized protein n=1 Tax=Penicillium canariense TaxID=189055 RepID=A0A9W9I996_9EURO|nr:uncharacterized protein N7482_006093 [Penicillium canariense]KAJ5167312.1 hypothetical protein N7482_006093 [Penicillium canariense]
MEVPAVEDSMEMASPYQGQADDFDIDIDLMEDHVSNMDSDMMGADDYPNTSQPSLFNTEANDDADMVDESTEGSMVDADVADEDNDIDVQYEEATFEAEMLEGDQVEEIDTPLPTIHIEVQAENKNSGDEPSQKIPTENGEVQQPSIQEGQGTVLSEAVSTANEPQDPQVQEQTIFLESSENSSSQPEQSEGYENQRNGEARVDHPETEPQETNETTETTESNVPVAEEHHDHVDTSENVPNVESAQVKSTDHGVGDGISEQPETHDLHETEDQPTHDDGSLLPVKVLYQEAEISLFPPMEGDSAETFFLHDEDVAYDNVGKLFGSLREVLLDNVAENEVLVIDIDSLGIQITEDSSHASNITLHRILDIYLRLCHNDGTDKPEALYLTLSSRLAVHSELAALEVAANEGKGLSQVHPWSEYEDGEDHEDSLVAEHLLEESHGDEDHHDQSTHEIQETHQEQAPPSGETPSQVHTVNDDAQKTPVEAIHEPFSSEHDSQVEPGTGATEIQQEEETARAVSSKLAEENAHDYGEEPYEESYDSEAHKTESTATVVPASDQIRANESTEDVSADVAESALEQHDADEEDGNDPEGEEFNDEDYDEESSGQDDYSGHEGLEHEEFQEKVVGEENDDSGAEDDAYPVDFVSAHDDEASNELDVAPANEDASADTLQEDVDHESNYESEPTMENTPQEEPGNHERAPELEDDLLGIAEDVMQTPAKDLEDDLEHIESVDLEQELEDGFPDAPTVDGNGANGDQADDGNGEYDDYTAFEVSDRIELGEIDPSHTDSHQPHENPSTKRSREEEDEWDIEETSTLENKRRRPS